MQLVVENVSKSFGINDIFKAISFMVDKGEKVGLVGVNGSGKSTLLRCLLEPGYNDSGNVRFEPGLKVGYVEQGFGSIGSGSLWDYMLRACPEILDLRTRLAELEAKTSALQDEQELAKALEAYANATKLYEHFEGYSYETRIKMVLHGLGFAEEAWEKDVTAFSGGQKTRILLAAALVKGPDFLILDEPTNHLDIVMIEWLEKYLLDFKGGLLTVSHDRAFLDNVADRILEMEGGHLTSFKGNYSKYLEQKEVQTKTLEAAYAAQQDYIARTEAYIRRFKAGIKSKMARGRQSQLDRFERMEAPVQNEEFALRLPKAPESAERVLVLDKLDIGYPGNRLLKGLELVVRKQEKVGLIGANGTGKSTLIKTILGELAPLAGRAQLGNRVQVGYFSQSYEHLNEKQTVLDCFLTEYGFTIERTRTLLGGMLFHGDDVFKEIATLSGGQKARLVLLKLVLDGANFLVLDEPTNHLDIMARETVEAALAAFDGTLLVVSHDRYFIREIADRIWEIEGSALHDYKGDYDYYLEQKARLAQTLAEQQVKAAEPKTLTTAAKIVQRDNSGSGKRVKHYSAEELQKLLAKVELNIREQEALLGVLAKQMENPENHVDVDNSKRLAAEYAQMQSGIAVLMEKWEELMQAQEELEQDET